MIRARWLLVCALGALPGCASQAQTGAATAIDLAPDRILVTLRYASPAPVAALAPSGRLEYALPSAARERATQLAQARRLADALDLVLEEEWPIPALGVHCVVFRTDSASRSEALAKLRANAAVESAQPMQFFHGETSQSPDPLAGWNPALDEGLRNAHSVSTGRSVRIAVIDAGMDLQHEDLRDARLEVRDLVDGSTGVPAEAHGTAVVGLLAARAGNGMGISGYAPDAEIMLLRACWETDAAGGSVCNSFTLAKALSYALQSGADIVNMSISGPRDPLLERLATELLNRGSLLVAAGTGPETFPASVPGAIVAADFSLSPPADAAALTLVPGNRYGMRHGTSIATARVTGIAALLKQLDNDLLALWLQGKPLPGNAAAIAPLIGMAGGAGALLGAQSE